MLTIVLARPEIPANIGFIARTMSCHGLADLRIVGRPGAAIHPDSIRTASGEEAVLEAARDFPDLEAALSDCAFALAFSRRVRDPGQRILDLPEAAAQFAVHAPQEAPARMALVFGRESQGLSREETMACSHLVRIPLPGPLLSLNLSHAAAIALYAFFGGAAPSASKTDEAPADVLPWAESERMLSAVIARMSEQGHFNSVKAEAHADYLRILWQRLQPTRRELEFLAGVLKKLAP